MKILITVPNLHWIHKLVVHRLLLFQQDRRYQVNISMPSNKPFENNLHHIINDFMSGDYDYWLTMDDDNPPEVGVNPLDLVAFDKDIIGCPTPVFHYTKNQKGDRPFFWNAFKWNDEAGAYNEWPYKEGLQKVDAIGTGCVMFARRVFENPEMRKGVFTRKLYGDGTVEKGNDISFCERARDQGFEIWCHFDYPCGHISELELADTARAFFQVRR